MSHALPRNLRARAAELVRTEARVLIGLFAVFAFVLLFFHVLGEVREGDMGKLESGVLLAFRQPGNLETPIGPRWLQETARDITALGGFTVLTLIVVLSSALLLIHRRWLQAVVFVAAVIFGQSLAIATKHLVGRPRPDLVPHLDQVYSSSFPSGHSSLSPIVYFTLAGIVAAGEGSRAAKVLLLAVSALLVLAIGASRVYLGVHWPSDVLAGWAIGTAVAIMATLVLRWTSHGKPRPAPPRT